MSSDNRSVATASVDNAAHTITVIPYQEGEANISVSTPDVAEVIACNYSYTSFGVNVTYSFSGGKLGLHSQLYNGGILIASFGDSVKITASPSVGGATGMVYAWSYSGDNIGGNLVYSTVGENVLTITNNGPLSFWEGTRQTGTLYLNVTHNGTPILSTSWPIYVLWD